jgi:hypothetical protein
MRRSQDSVGFVIGFGKSGTKPVLFLKTKAAFQKFFLENFLTIEVLSKLHY